MADTPDSPILTEYMGGLINNTLGEIAAALGGRSAALSYDSTAGEYVHVGEWLAGRADGLAYGVSIPTSAAVACTKLGANSGIAVPTLSVGSVAGYDPYAGRGPFFYIEVNGYVDADGTPHVTAIRGDGRFSRAKQTWILAPVLWYKWTVGATACLLWVSDTPLAGYSAQPQAYLPNGTMRPYMLYAKYPLAYQSGGIGAGYANTKSGLEPWTSNQATTVSHDGLISIMATSSTGYSGKSVADDWYLKAMFLLKYATKNSQAYFPQCSDYYKSYAITVAESGATRAIIATTDASNLVVGSSCYVNASDNANAHSMRILSIDKYDDSNSAVNLDGTVTTATSQKLWTRPWLTGSCDIVEGDGVLGSGSRYPCVLQGIEFGHGMAEVLGDVIVSSDGSTGWIPYVNHDSKNEATSVGSTYRKTASLPVDTSDSWKYPLYPSLSEGLMFGQQTGGSQGTGLCDGNFTNKQATTGTREWLSLGFLVDGGLAGLFYANAGNALGISRWNIGSRASATGRAKA